MSKFAVFTLLFMIQTACTRPAAASSACRVQSRSERDAVVNVGGRVVTLIGWEHLDDDTGGVLSNGLKDAQAQARAGQCAEAVRTARATRTTLSEQLDGTRVVLSKIEAAHAVAPASFVGVEQTDDEWVIQQELMVTLDERFADLESLCGPELKAEADILRIMAPGPEFAFAKMHPNVSIEAMEDQALKDANEKDFDGADQDTFDQNDPAMTEESKLALVALNADVMAQRPASEVSFRAATAFEKDPVRRAKLDGELRFKVDRQMRIIRGAYARNTAIAARILKLPGNGAVALGWSHIDHLVDELLHQCEAL